MTEEMPILIKEHDGIIVFRDDITRGGTKARVIPHLFDHHKEYVYASPVQGYAQVALANAAKHHGKRAVIFCAGRRVKHPRTLEAAEAGARIVEVSPAGYLSVVQKRARDYCNMFGARLLPFGLDTPEIRNLIASFARTLPIDPFEVWTVAGSGVLTRSLQLAWPKAKFNAVQIGAEPNIGTAKLYKAGESFEDNAKYPPPFPSCSNYDAKAWQFIRKHASPGALFWNVAK